LRVRRRRRGISIRSAERQLERILLSAIRRTVPVRTGALRRSLKIRFGVRGIGVKMLYYGKYVHEGTRYIRPNPFITIAVKSVKLRIRALERRTGTKWIIRVFGKRVH
jgi:hypothetical protein